MEYSVIGSIVVALATIVIIVCSIGIIIASRFQNKQKMKYKELENILKKNKGATFRVRQSLSKEEIKNVDNNTDAGILMKELYNTYLIFENKVKTYDINLDDVLTGYLKEFYINKIQNFQEKGYADIIDGIDLLNYSIVEYSKDKLKFRIMINCFSYKKVNDVIVSGSNLEKIQRIMLLTYEKENDKWLISSYEKVYEKKLSN